MRLGASSPTCSCSCPAYLQYFINSDVGWSKDTHLPTQGSTPSYLVMHNYQSRDTHLCTVYCVLCAVYYVPCTVCCAHLHTPLIK